MSGWKLILGEERLVSMAPPQVTGWGPWQFPSMYTGPAGELYLAFHNAPDTYSGYGMPDCKYRSDDQGKSWYSVNCYGGLVMEDGSMLRPAQLEAFAVDQIQLPQAVVHCKYCYVKDAVLYDMAQVDPAYKKWHHWRIRDGQEQLEQVKMDVPGYLMRVSNGLLIQPFLYMPYYYPASDNRILAVSYHPLLRSGSTSTYFDALFFESLDQGKSFHLLSSIPYLPPYEEIEDSENCQGWLEPGLCLLDEHTAFVLLRTTCVKGVRPLFIAWSYDGCRSWSTPELLDDVGVFPQAVQLENGAVLAGYGRPGLYVRAMSKDTKAWGKRVTIVPPKELMKDSCSYCALTPLGPDRALIAYSRFDLTDEENRPRKGMMCREITVIPERG